VESQSIAQPPTILLYTDDPGTGGVAQYNHAILLGLRSRGYGAICVQGKTANPLIDRQLEAGVEHEWLTFDTIRDFDRVVFDSECAIEIFTRRQPDLILFSDNCPFSNLAAKHVAKQLDIPYLAVIGFVAADLSRHLGDLDPTPYLNALSVAYEAAKGVIAVSGENLELLHQVYKLPADRGQVIHYGRPDCYFTPRDAQTRDRLRREVGIPADAVVCLTAARLEAVKGYQYQLEAIRQLQQGSGWQHLYFVWIGDGILKEDLATAIDNLGVGDRVKLLGQRWDVADWHDAADLFILPSELEGMPLAIMEAMAKGNPVIASAVSGIPEELGETGCLLPDPNCDREATIAALVSTIEQWVANPSLREQLGQASQARAQQMFREARMVAQTITQIDRALLPKGDYVSPGLAIVRPDLAFPNMTLGEPNTCPWPYLRQEIPHNWYVDRRNPTIGFLSRDEALILYNIALQFQGKRALEIGCWMGWSACHLALAGVVLDVIDPLLARSEVYDSVRGSLEAAGVIDRVNLVPGYSPQQVELLASQQQRRWSLIFIDGNHEAPGPLQDAIACEPYAETDAAIVFHDLASPDVAEGLNYFRQQGWNTLVYQTMQIMGIAWRGNVQPVAHQSDRSVSWQLPTHLQQYPVSAIAEANAPDAIAQLLVQIEQLPAPETRRGTLQWENRDRLTPCLQRGKAAYIRGNWTETVAALTPAIEINPASAIARGYLSTAYWHLEDVQASLEHQAIAYAAPTWVEDIQGEEFQALLAAVRHYTVLSQERLFSLYSLAKQICLDDIPGDFVECGTYRGGSAALLAAVVKRYSVRPRRVYAFDTFAGMPEPTEVDRYQGIAANDTEWGAGTLNAPMDEYLAVVCQALDVQEVVVPVPGLFAETLPVYRQKIGEIALLHADGDWYESTWEIFDRLFDLVVAEGFIQIDDYGHWEGCRQAVEEFERSRNVSFPLCAIDYTGVWFRKSDPTAPDVTYWRSLFTLAQTAQKQGERELARRMARSMLRLVPNLVQAEAMLAGSDALAALRQVYPLREINLLARPDWQQEEEALLLSLMDVLRKAIEHPECDRLCVLFDTSGIELEAADLAISCAAMQVSMEMEMEEVGVEIALVKPGDLRLLRSVISGRI
jgi:glycosyltransferase involved in cell wall biosynthesis/predicted O-methyltransferase YrrM